MEIKDLENLRNSLNKIIDSAKNSKTVKQVMELENTAFTKYQRYIAGSISIKKCKLSGYSNKHPEKLQLQEELNQYLFIEKTIVGFIDAELKPQRDKIYINN